MPSPLLSHHIEEKILKALEMARPEDLQDEASRRNFVDTLPEHVRGCYGGNSACVQLEVGGKNLVFDCGTGLRVLGLDLMEREFQKGRGEVNIFLSHTHWDHIMGLPFFLPLFTKGNRIRFYGVHKDIGERLMNQQDPRYFPVAFSSFTADVEVLTLDGKQSVVLGDEADPITVTWKEMDHPGMSFSYRVEYRGKSVVYATDAEYKKLSPDSLKPTIDFFRDADLLVFDSQYTFIEGVEKEDWGHSSTFIGVDIALEASVRNLAFYHHEPTYSDFKLVNILDKTRKYLAAIGGESPLNCFLAREGKTFDLLAE
ncbi:MBL fold metallo-hydrolase [Nitrospina gracilis]|uniref:MBL fold metallo-hydrolase n=1 Tax=Nitrospina gracilis TaxID=35801 RepID=UPI001F3E7126|nr:MBL fold metallo-hydrolase [Nitrospina gracilis]MCF8720252.1 phosphoribosyl 1,2-cyclic phosphodiesterase [Nitrospina gracilis Nb-211]